MSIAAIVDALVEAGATPQMIAAAVRAYAENEEAAKAERRDTNTDARARDPEWHAKRNYVLGRDGFRCTYCGSDGGAFPLEADHVVPVCQGGSNDIQNLVAACKPCNASKRHRTPEQWRAGK